MSLLCIYSIDLIYFIVILLVLMNRKYILNQPEHAGQDDKGISLPDNTMRILAVIIARRILKKHAEIKNNITLEEVPIPGNNK